MNGIQEVRGSIPLISTKLQKKHKTSIRVSDARFWFSFDPLLVGHRGGFYCFYRRNWELITKQPGGLPTAAILPVALCRCFWHVSLQCWQSPNRRPLCYLRPQPRISHLTPIQRIHYNRLIRRLCANNYDRGNCPAVGQQRELCMRADNLPFAAVQILPASGFTHQ